MASIGAPGELRRQYLAFLAQHGVHERLVEDALRDLIKAAVASGDRVAAQRFRRELAAIDPLNPPPHPATLLLERSSARVANAISHYPRFGSRHIPVYIGEFPVGSVNALSTRTPYGFLVLVNSGLFTFLEQVVQALCLDGLPNDGDQKPGPATVDVLAAVVRAYLEVGDPLYGPTPRASGALGRCADVAAAHCDFFVAAHEYAHIYLGHFDTSATVPQFTSAGSVSALPRSWEQEYEADDAAFDLLLESTHDTPSTSDPDRARIIDMFDSAMAAAAPILVMEMFGLIEAARDRAPVPTSMLRTPATHPPSVDRERRMVMRVARDPRFSPGLQLPAALRAISEPVVERCWHLDAETFQGLVHRYDL